MMSAACCCVLPLHAGDWTGFRGPETSGAAATGTSASWPVEPELGIVWRRDAGSGYGTIVAHDGVGYVAMAAEDSDVLVAFELSNGSEIWRLSLGPLYAGHGGAHDGPSATPRIAEGRVFAVGGHGRLVAATLDGEESWRIELSDYGREPIFGYASSPTYAGGVLVTQLPTADGHILFGLEPDTGTMLWAAGQDRSGFQSPVALTLGGREQVVASGDTEIFGVDPHDGTVLWRHALSGPPAPKGSAVNVPLPLGDDMILIKSSGRSSEALRIDVDAGTVSSVWTSKDLGASYTPATLVGGVIYGYRGAFLSAVDAATGTTLWRSRPPGDGFLAAVDPYLLVATKRGELYLLDSSRDGYRERARLQVFDEATWSDPIVSGGDIYTRSTGGLARVTLRPASRLLAPWIDTERRGAALPDTKFGGFVRGLSEVAAKDRVSAIDHFLADIDEFPIVEGSWVHIVYRGAEESVGLLGDLGGARYQDQMTQVPGTDLFYFSAELPADAWISYSVVPGLAEDATLPIDLTDPNLGLGMPDPLNPRLSADPLAPASYFTMPDYEVPAHLRDDASLLAPAGRIERHEVDLTPVDFTEAEPRGLFQRGPVELPRSQTIEVYLPPGYEGRSAERSTYPVLFFFGGDLARQPLQLDRTLDHLIADGLPPAVVVFVHRLRPPGFDDIMGWARTQSRAFFGAIVPFVDTHYRVDRKPAGRSYLGAGWVGALAIANGLDPASRAGRVAALQPMMIDLHRDIYTAVAKARVDLQRSTEHSLPALYVESSIFDQRAEQEAWNAGAYALEFAERLDDLGFEVTTRTTNQGYAPIAWRDRLHIGLRFLLAPDAP